MNGWKFREAQLRDVRFAGVPVVVISADSNLPEKVGYFGGSFLCKPLDIEDLLRTIQAVAR